MKWRGRRQSENVEDRRGQRGKVAAGSGIGLLIIAMIVGLLGGDPRRVMQQGQQRQAQVQADRPGGDPQSLSKQDIERGQFVKTIFADSEMIWADIFRKSGKQYVYPKMVLFGEQTTSGCGVANAAAGPFYCPADQKVYLDTAFFDQLSRQLGAPGDFAQAYVVAHEVGHHVQNLLGMTDKMDQMRGRVPQVEYNKYSVKLELQADFYAGVMFHHAQKRWSLLEEGDIEEGLRAAAAIGDDTLQKRSNGAANQESFTHGSSEQRVRWFMRGLQTGDPAQGDTFNAQQL